MAIKYKGTTEEEDSKPNPNVEWQEICQIKRTLADKQRILEDRI